MELAFAALHQLYAPIWIGSISFRTDSATRWRSARRPSGLRPRADALAPVPPKRPVTDWGELS
jgi:hypothetical protein